MHSIRADFRRLSAIPVTELFQAVGVYVIWDGMQMAKPSYIGQGIILDRLASHSQWCAHPVDGYAAVLGDESRQYFRSDAAIVETLLLEVSADTDRYPTQNKARGSFTKIVALFRTHGVLKVRVSGFDPLQPPWNAKALHSPKLIQLRTGQGDGGLIHDWRMRRRLR